MNDRELMNRVFDRTCADELSALELLARSGRGAQVRGRSAALIAAGAAAAIGVGVFALYQGLAPETDSEAEPVRRPEQTETSALTGSVTESASSEVSEEYTDSENNAVKMPAFTTSVSGAAVLPEVTDNSGLEELMKNWAEIDFTFPDKSSDTVQCAISPEELEVLRSWRERHLSDTINGGSPAQSSGWPGRASAVIRFNDVLGRPVTITKPLGVEEDSNWQGFYLNSDTTSGESFFAWYSDDLWEDNSDINRLVEKYYKLTFEDKYGS